MVDGFKVASQPVSIGAFREFVVSAKGYSNPRFWRPSHFECVGSKQSCPSSWTLTVSFISPFAALPFSLSLSIDAESR